MRCSRESRIVRPAYHIGDLGFPALVFRGRVLMTAQEASELVFKEYTYLPS